MVKLLVIAITNDFIAIVCDVDNHVVASEMMGVDCGVLGIENTGIMRVKKWRWCRGSSQKHCCMQGRNIICYLFGLLVVG